MLRRLEDEDRFVLAAHHEVGVGVGRVGLRGLGSGGQVVWNGDATRCLVMEGELYDTAPLEQLAAEADRPAADDQAGLVLRLYERFGCGILPKLNGAFVVAIWDRPARRLTLFNDRLGLLPMYYGQTTRGGLLFASGVRGLLADPDLRREVDLVAINEFLVFDHALDDRTLLQAVKLLPQASVLTFGNGTVRIQPYWTLCYPDDYDFQEEATYVEEFVHCLRRAAERQQAKDLRAAVLLSGGLDSRLLAGALADVDNDLDTVTFGIPGCDDASAASEVARTLGMRHSFVELKSNWLQELAHEAVRITDGLGNIINLHALVSLANPQTDLDVVYKGFMGDALLGWAVTRHMWGGYGGEARYQVQFGIHSRHGVVYYDSNAQADLLSDGFQRSVGNAVWEAYCSGMDRSGSSQLANQRLYFDLTQRVPRMTLRGVDVVRHRAIVRLPFCDNDLLEFVLRVPPGFLFERYLTKTALLRYYPRLASVPVAGTGRPMTSCARDVMWQARALVTWHLGRFGLERIVARRPRPYKDYDGWFRSGLQPWVEGILLDRRTLERGYFKPEYVRWLLDEHAAGVNHAVRLGALLTIELWHRQFLA